MIKVNLLKDAGKKQRKVGESTIADSDFKSGMGSGDKNALGKRAAFFLVPVVAAFIYNWYIESGLSSDLAKLNTQSAEIDGKMAALRTELDVIEQLKAEKNKVSTELTAIKEVSKKRYTYVKILESLQSLIPEKAWVTKLNFKDQIISIEGRATEDSIISTFMQSLEESAYFSNVTWIDSREISEPQGVVKAFTIRFNLENI